MTGFALAKVGGVLSVFFLVVIAVLAGVTGRQYQLHSDGTGGSLLLGAFVFFSVFFAWGGVALLLFGRKGGDGRSNAGSTRRDESNDRDDRDDTGSSPDDSSSAPDDRSGGGGDYAGGGATGRW